MALPLGIATRVRFYSHLDDDDFNPVVIGGLMMYNIKCPAGRDKGIKVVLVVVGWSLRRTCGFVVPKKLNDCNAAVGHRVIIIIRFMSIYCNLRIRAIKKEIIHFIQWFQGNFCSNQRFCLCMSVVIATHNCGG